MLNNPLHDNPEREHRVRERAYHLWEADGKPHGRDVEYWQRAGELVAIQENGEADRPPNHAASVRETGVEEADIQENLGEFPDGFADRGGVQQTPTAVHSPRRRRATPAAAPRKSPAKPKKTK